VFCAKNAGYFGKKRVPLVVINEGYTNINSLSSTVFFSQNFDTSSPLSLKKKLGLFVVLIMGKM
jgi:hypothetical protein